MVIVRVMARKTTRSSHCEEPRAATSEHPEALSAHFGHTARIGHRRCRNVARQPIGVGGITYTVGVVFHMWDRLRFATAVWHVFVLLGAGAHYAAVASVTSP